MSPNALAGPAAAAPDAALRSPAQSVALDWQRLAGYLAAQGHALDLESAPRQFSGGLGNLNFLVRVDGQPCVLRRPPFGEVPLGANDMAREHRVLSRLWQAWPLAPRSLDFCGDAAVLGAPFLLMEYRPGLVIGGRLPPDAQAATAGPALSSMLVRVLASLHAVDAAAIGLGDFG